MNSLLRINNKKYILKSLNCLFFKVFGIDLPVHKHVELTPFLYFT